jgi:hypothetical protein
MTDDERALALLRKMLVPHPRFAATARFSMGSGGVQLETDTYLTKDEYVLVMEIVKQEIEKAQT